MSATRKKGKELSAKKASMQERRKQVADLYLKGMSQWEIAIKVGVSQPTVSTDLTDIMAEWKAERIIGYDDVMAKELARINHLEEVAWQAWERSCEPIMVNHKRTENVLQQPKPAQSEEKDDKGVPTGRMKIIPGVGEPAKMVAIRIVNDLKRTGQVGDDRFLGRVAWCIEMRCKLLDLVKVEKAGNTNITIINWDTLQGKPPEDAEGTLDPLEVRIQQEAKAVQALPPPHTNGKNGAH